MSTLQVVISKLTVISLLMLLSACGAESQAPEQELRLQQVREIDLQQLPSAGWALSNSVIQLSFCRDRMNTALLAKHVFSCYRAYCRPDKPVNLAPAVTAAIQSGYKRVVLVRARARQVPPPALY